jgi:hypothetical protein
MILSYDQRWWWDCYDLGFHVNKLAMMTMILKYGKEGSLIENYLAKQEGFINKKLSCRAREV